MLARQAAVTFDLCVKNDHRQSQIRKTTAMLKGLVKLASSHKSAHMVGLFCPYSRSLLTLVWSSQAGKSSPAQLAHKAGLLCKEVCGASQASCFLAQEDEGLSSWSKLSDGKAEVFLFLSLVFLFFA